jgi:transposase
MIKVEFSEETKAELAYQRYNHPHPFVQRKMEAMWLKSQDFSHKDICRVTGVCYTTLETYLKEYNEGGVESLKTLPFYRPRSDLEEHRATLEAYFQEHPPSSATQAMEVIERLTGLKRSPERVRQFMRRIGMKCRKVGTVPAKGDPDKQDDFKKKRSSRDWKTQKPRNGLYFS